MPDHDVRALNPNGRASGTDRGSDGPTAATDRVMDERDLSTGTIDPGEVVTATFTVPEEPVAFVCTFHPGMTGRLVPASQG